jgi:hypothetical protein
MARHGRKATLNHHLGHVALQRLCSTRELACMAGVFLRTSLLPVRRSCILRERKTTESACERLEKAL